MPRYLLLAGGGAGGGAGFPVFPLPLLLPLLLFAVVALLLVVAPNALAVTNDSAASAQITYAIFLIDILQVEF
jgi:hypothetical protein